LAVDDAGEIVFANEAFAAMTGYSRQALVSMTVQFPDCLYPAAELRRRLGLARVCQFGHAVTHADGWTMPALVSDSVLIREDETLAVVAFTDLTEIAWHTSSDDELLPG
jgi:PAS domain S-box-containing protein